MGVYLLVTFCKTLTKHKSVKKLTSFIRSQSHRMRRFAVQDNPDEIELDIEQLLQDRQMYGGASFSSRVRYFSSS